MTYWKAAVLASFFIIGLTLGMILGGCSLTASIGREHACIDTQGGYTCGP